MPCPLPRRTRTGARVGCFPVCTAFPETQAGRRPRLHFRGLLRLHSRYGLSDCSIARGDLCHEASARWVAPPNRSSATSATDNSLGGTFLHWQTAPSGRTEFFGHKRVRPAEPPLTGANLAAGRVCTHSIRGPAARSRSQTTKSDGAAPAYSLKKKAEPRQEWH